MSYEYYEKTEIEYEDDGDDGPGRFKATQEKSKYRLKCLTNTVTV
jgi:hypothetical protein